MWYNRSFLRNAGTFFRLKGIRVTWRCELLVSLRRWHPCTKCKIFNGDSLPPSATPRWRVTPCWLFPKAASIHLHHLPHPLVAVCRKIYCILFMSKWKKYVRISPFIDQHFCNILCLIDHMLIIVSTRFIVHWHHLRGDPFNCKFLETHQIITQTHIKRLQFSKQQCMPCGKLRSAIL